MARYDLSEAEWRLIEPLLPNKPRGVARVDDRRVINGIFYVLRTARRGAICPSALASGRSSISASTDGPRAAFSSWFSGAWRVITTTSP